MPIEMDCPGCARRLRVADHHAGKTARCPACQTLYKVPLAGPSATGPSATGPSATGPSATGMAGTGSLAGPESRRWLLKTDDGQVYGPVDRFELDGWVAQGRVTPGAQVQQEGDAVWQRADQVFPELQFREPLAGASTNPFADQTPAGNWYESPGGGAFAPARSRYAEPHRGGLVLALGLIGWIFGCPIIAPIAIVLAVIDLQKMNAGRMDPSGKGLTIAGLVLAIIYTVLTVGFLLFVGLLVLFGN